MNDRNPSYHVEIAQMLYIAGETTEPSIPTTHLIERIVQQQVVEILTQASALTLRRGARTISAEDIIFVVRHDAAKVSRLRTFLSWKDVRKNLKDDDEKGGAPEVAGDAVGDPVESAVVGEAGEAGGDSGVSKKVKRKGIALPWDPSSFFSIIPPSAGNEEEDSEDNDDETMRRLQTNDERTRDLTREEYAHWAECRQASFTWRKAKRFKEWSKLADVHEGGRVGEDVLDLLGFLCAEIVQVLGVEARKVLSETDARSNAHTRQTKANDKQSKRNANQGLFVIAEGSRNAIDACHIREATRRLQQMKGAKSRAFAGLGSRRMDGGKRLILI